MAWYLEKCRVCGKTLNLPAQVDVIVAAPYSAAAMETLDILAQVKPCGIPLCKEHADGTAALANIE